MSLLHRHGFRSKRRIVTTVSADRGFTLIELLVVIAIIGILAGLLMAGITRAYYSARMADCKNNLKQFELAITMYKKDYEELPPWLSNLYPDYVRNRKMYICKQDPTRGKEGGKPPWQTGQSTEQYAMCDDFNGSEAATEDAQAAGWMNPDVEANSYLYEFSIASCPFDVGPLSEVVPGGGKYTWRAAKEYEAKYWPNVPLISCFWHTSGFFTDRDIVLRLGYETHDVYTSDTTADGWKSHN